MSLHPDISINDWTNKDIVDYLKELDNATVELTQWEADFVESCLKRKSFSPKQREVVRKLYVKYGDNI